jgi:hypothetical protein
VAFEEQTPETAQGKALFQELLMIHGMIRRDLATVAKLAAEVLDGLPPHRLQAEISRLEANGPLWQLKVNCLRYCRFVHGHHNFEDAAFFPMLRATNPGIDPVVDRLEAEHRKVSDLLDEVEASAASLTELDNDAGRERVFDALRALADDLLAHLEYEELSVGPTLRRVAL